MDPHLEALSRLVNESALTRDEMRFAVSFGVSSLYGLRIPELVTPQENPAYSEPTVVVKLGRRSDVPKRPQPRESSLLDDFLMLVTDLEIAQDVGQQTEHVLWLAERFGLLGLCKHHLPHYHHPDCDQTFAEPISAWVAWAVVFEAARRWGPVPQAEQESLGLVWARFHVSAYEIIDWLAQAHGLKASGPPLFVPGHGGLFKHLHAELVVNHKLVEAETKARCQCGILIPSKSVAKGATTCKSCQKARKAENTRNLRSREKNGPHMLRFILEFFAFGNPTRQQQILEEIVTRPSVLGALDPDDLLAEQIRTAAYKLLDETGSPP